jgi:hypothetical protein
MSRNHCVGAVIGRRSSRATSFMGRVITATAYCFEPWRRMAADFASVACIFLAPPTTFATVNYSIQTRGERLAPRFNY